MAAPKRKLIAVTGLLVIGIAVAVTLTIRELSPAVSSHAQPTWVPHGTTLVWAIRPRDLLACRSAGYALRRIQRQHGKDVRLVVASVGADTAWVSSMLRSERLEATIQRVSERAYRSTFWDRATPRVYLFDDGQIVTSHIIDADSLDEVDKLEQALTRLSARG